MLLQLRLSTFDAANEATCVVKKDFHKVEYVKAFFKLNENYVIHQID